MAVLVVAAVPVAAVQLAARQTAEIIAAHLVAILQAVQAVILRAARAAPTPAEAVITNEQFL